MASTCEEPTFVGNMYFPTVFKGGGNLFFFCLFFSLKSLWYVLRVTFPMRLLPSKIGCPCILGIKKAK